MSPLYTNMTISGLGDVWRVHKERHLKPSVGIIDGWLPEDEAEGDPALWHCKYKDGDEEELDFKEMTRFLIDTDEDNQYFVAPSTSTEEGVKGLNKSISSTSLTSSSSKKDSEEKKVYQRMEIWQRATSWPAFRHLVAKSGNGKKGSKKDSAMVLLATQSQ